VDRSKYLNMCRTKIHRATVTESNLEYEGSITIDSDLIEKADLYEYEMVHGLNLNTGSRIETYVIRGEAGSGVICLNGPAARLGTKGDSVIIIAYALVKKSEAESHRPTIVMVDQNNRIKHVQK